MIISIIITYNGTKWIDKCFGSLVNSTVPLKILVIDNASTDGTPKIIREKFPRIEVIETGQNIGFGKANNIGLKKAYDEGSDYVFLLNQDAWVEADTIEKLVKSQKENNIFHLLSPIHLNGKGDAIDYNFQTYLTNQFTPNFYSDLFLNKVKPLYEGRYANAAAWLLTRECIEKVGGFDPLFTHYGEDDDYINRLHSKSLKLAIVPSAIIYHDRTQSGIMNEKFYENQIYFNALLKIKRSVIRKHYIFRKIIADYFTLYFVHLGRNNDLKNTIASDLMFLHLSKRVKKQNFKVDYDRAPYL